MTQSQKAGSGSSQVQVHGDVINQTFQLGPTKQEMEVALREEGDRILDTIRKEVAATYVAEGQVVAQSRIGLFDQKLLDVLAHEGTLDALKDPAFQVLLKRAQIGAASTEREADYDLLANLLGERTRDGDRRARASIARAVDVVDSLDDAALQGLTLLFYLWDLQPGQGDIETGLDFYSRGLGKIGFDILPMGEGWLDHIDILGLARIERTGSQTLKNFQEKFAAAVPGYTCRGVAEDQALNVEKKFLDEAGVEFKLVPHYLKPGYLRLPYARIESLKANIESPPLSSKQQQRAVEIAISDTGIDQHDPDVVPRFVEAVDARPELAACAAWWNQIPYPPIRTSAGTAVGYSNAARFISMAGVPPLHEYLLR